MSSASEKRSRGDALGIVAIWLLLLLGLPSSATAQPNVTAPEAGSNVSYRNAVIEWDPIPGVSLYHLEVDDDPAFGSPEVDVFVPETTYSLSGEVLRLNGRLSWPQYVRINGERWDAGTFAPAIPSFRSPSGGPAIAVQASGEVLYAHTQSNATIVSSADWSDHTILSAVEAFWVFSLSIRLDPMGVAHAFWGEEQLRGGSRVRLLVYANSDTNWSRQEIASTNALGLRFVLSGSQIEAFLGTDRFISSDGGTTFRRETVPHTETFCYGVSALDVDAAGTIYRLGFGCEGDLVLQRSVTGFDPEFIGPGHSPELAVSPEGVIHAVRIGSMGDYSYSNSSRGFVEWTPLPLPIGGWKQYRFIRDHGSGTLYAAKLSDDGLTIASSYDDGSTWESQLIDSISSIAGGPLGDLVVDRDGALHVTTSSGLYANSLGAFLATNLVPTAELHTPVETDAAIGIRATLADPDSDALSGRIEVGIGEAQAVSLSLFETVEIFPGLSIMHWTRWPHGGTQVNSDTYGGLEFRFSGDINWTSGIPLSQVESQLPVMIEVRTPDGSQFDTFEITAWEYDRATALQDAHVDITLKTFTPLLDVPFENSELPETVDISSLPDGPSRVRLTASDDDHQIGAQQSFSKRGQGSLLLGGIQSAVPGKRIVLQTERDDDPTHFEAHLELPEGIMLDHDPKKEVTTVGVHGFDDENNPTGVIELDPNRWRSSGKGQGFHYLDPSGSRGGIVEVKLAPKASRERAKSTDNRRADTSAASSPVRRRSGQLWIRGLGEAVPWSPPSRAGRVRFDFTVGSEIVCALFSENAAARFVEDGPERFLALHAPATEIGCGPSN
jgi:hypothetical protein